MRKLKDFWPLLIIVFVIGLFFYRLFFPPSIFVTPDFGLSDTLNQNFAFRTVLHEALQQGHLPWWDEKMGMGFPLLAEGQVGALNLFNLILAYFFPPWLSFNLTYILAFLMIGVFTYLFAQEVGLGKLAALFSSVVLIFSGPLMGHLIHLNLLLTFAYFPLELWLVEKVLEKTAGGKQRTEIRRQKAENRLIWWVILTLVINQQILAGHLQVVVYSLITLILYLIFRLMTLYFYSNFSVQNNPNFPESTLISDLSKQRLIKIFLLFLTSLGLAVILSLPQLLPSFELAKQSGRSGNLPVEELTRFPFQLKNLLGFLNPNWLGNPKLGDYGKGDQNWGLWWENTGYVGIAALLLVVASILYLVLKGGRFLKFSIFIGLIIVGILLALGVGGPFFWLYKVPPLSLFRVPARWMFFISFSLAILAGFGVELLTNLLKFSRITQITVNKLGQIRVNLGKLDKLSTTTFLSIGLFLITIFDLWFYFYNHNPIGKVDEWLSPPSTVEFIKNYDPNYQNYRVYDLGATIFWDKYFWEEGFGGEKLERFKNLREGLTPNLASIWGLSSADVYAGVKPLNLAKLQYLLAQHQAFESDPESLYQLSFDDLGMRILSSQNIKYIMTPLKINQDKEAFLAKIYEKELPEFTIRVYENLQVWPRFYFVENIQENFTLPISDSSFIIRTSEPQDSKVALEVENPKDSFLVWSQSFYPGWKVWVDGQETKIYQYNINQMAVFLKAGKHQTKFSYEGFIR